MPFLIKKNNKFISLGVLCLLCIILIQVSVAATDKTDSTAYSLESGGSLTETAADTLEPASWLPVFRKAFVTSSSGTGPIFGVNFISSAENLADEMQFQNGLSTGATWNRWPIYWNRIENTPGVFIWDSQDLAIMGDIANGLKTNAILLSTPGIYSTSSVSTAETEQSDGRGMFEILAPQAAAPVGLYEPVFTDGTDIPGTNKQINLANKWANFTQLAVNRYKPGGILAENKSWEPYQGITHWEMWNEPDLDSFWDSSLPDYARLLKVGYLAAKHADPNAQVLFAGLANNHLKPEYYRQVLEIYANDPLASQQNFFHDILATHNYSNSWESWWHVFRARQTMSSFGLDKPIWLNETGVPAWDDYPGPVWDETSGNRATTVEQADFVIQTAFYATFAGAEAIFHFQLYDGCGNQPYGTDFPPHDGGLCGLPEYPICGGDANGLFSNPDDAGCFTQHDYPETKRPNFDAFKLLTTYFDNVEPLWRERPGGSNPYDAPQELIAFYKPETKERIIGMWTRFDNDEVAEIPASDTHAILLYPNGAMENRTPTNGKYLINLPAATNHNLDYRFVPNAPPFNFIGGRPSILIESDRLAPIVTGEASFGPEGIELSWSGDDNQGSGIIGYDVTVSIDGRSPVPWISDSESGPALYRSQSGESYRFWVTARDRAGNVSSPVLVVPVDSGEA